MGQRLRGLRRGRPLGARAAAFGARRGWSGGVRRVLSGGPGATFSLPKTPDAEIGGLAGTAVELFETACAKLGLEHRGIARVDVLDERLLDLELSRDPEGYLGVTEIAKLLRVSRQRVGQLREREDFPAPIVEIAAGPVWTRTSLTRFVEAWPRKPGRPRSEDSTA